MTNHSRLQGRIEVKFDRKASGNAMQNLFLFHTGKHKRSLSKLMDQCKLNKTKQRKENKRGEKFFPHKNILIAKHKN